MTEFGAKRRSSLHCENLEGLAPTGAGSQKLCILYKKD